MYPSWLSLLCHSAAGLTLLVVSLHGRNGKSTRAAARIGALAAGLFVISGLLPSIIIATLQPGLLASAYGMLVAAQVLLTLLPIAFWYAGQRRVMTLPGIGGLLAAASASILLKVWAPVDSTQPVWPLPWTISLDSFHTDAVFRIELLRGLPWCTLAVSLLIATVAFGRRPRSVRLALLSASLTILWLKTPDLAPLFVPAYPSSYFRSATHFGAAAILRGEALYRSQCVGCHGAAGRGDGVMAASLPRPPADLTAEHLWMHSDGELFWWLSHGIATADGIQVMPGYAASLTSEDIWSVIDYIRSLNAGAARARLGHWSPTVLAPDLPLSCEAGRTRRLSDLKGTPARIVVGTVPAVGAGVITVLITDDRAITPRASTCIADAGLAKAYAITAGLTPDAADGTQFLIDRDGWLRAIQRPNLLDGWNDPAQLAASLWLLAATPIIGDTSFCHAQN